MRLIWLTLVIGAIGEIVLNENIQDLTLQGILNINITKIVSSWIVLFFMICTEGLV